MTKNEALRAMSALKDTDTMIAFPKVEHFVNQIDGIPLAADKVLQDRDLLKRELGLEHIKTPTEPPVLGPNARHMVDLVTAAIDRMPHITVKGIDGEPAVVPKYPLPEEFFMWAVALFNLGKVMDAKEHENKESGQEPVVETADIKDTTQNTETPTTENVSFYPTQPVNQIPPGFEPKSVDWIPHTME